MRIDWVQTLLGDQGSHRQKADSSGPDGHHGRVARAMRRAGVLMSALFIGIAIAALPARGTMISLTDILALSGLLLAQASGLFLLAPERSRFRGAAFSALMALPFATLAGLEATIIIALGLVLALDMAAMLVAGQTRIQQVLLAVGASIASVALIWGGATVGAAALLLAALAPVAVAAFLPEPAQTRPQFDPLARFNALLGAALTSRRRRLLVTDSVGSIDTASDPAFARLLMEQDFPDNSLVGAVMIADRVLLLDALSRAIHKHQGTEGLTIRLRCDPAGAGFPAPPRFTPHHVSIQPLPDTENRAIVLIEEIDSSPAGTPVAERPAMPDVSPVLARALHDSTAPFNAGLGYLEMIADPRLSPRDVNTYRDFAAEAHKSVLEAYRNTVLLGRWVKLLHGDPAERLARSNLMPRRMVNDAVRTLNLREAEDRGQLRIAEAESLPAVSLPPALARFAVEIFLREAQYGGPVRVTIAREGEDLILRSQRQTPAEPQEVEDVFGTVIEDAISAAWPGAEFQAGHDGTRSLRFASAFSARIDEDSSAGCETGSGLHRLAS